MTKTVIVLVGLPGSGKSFQRNLMIGENPVIFSSDDLIDNEADRQGKTYSEIFKEYIKTATAEATAIVDDAIANDKPVIWDQTNMSFKKRASIIDKFNGYNAICVCILPPFTDEQQNDLDDRINNREGKDIPHFVMKSMRDNFELPTIDEGFSAVFYLDIYGSSVSFSEAQSIYGDTS